MVVNDLASVLKKYEGKIPLDVIKGLEKLPSMGYTIHAYNYTSDHSLSVSIFTTIKNKKGTDKTVELLDITIQPDRSWYVDTNVRSKKRSVPAEERRIHTDKVIYEIFKKETTIFADQSNIYITIKDGSATKTYYLRSYYHGDEPLYYNPIDKIMYTSKIVSIPDTHINECLEKALNSPARRARWTVNRW